MVAHTRLAATHDAYFNTYRHLCTSIAVLSYPHAEELRPVRLHGSFSCDQIVALNICALSNYIECVCLCVEHRVSGVDVVGDENASGGFVET